MEEARQYSALMRCALAFSLLAPVAWAETPPESVSVLVPVTVPEVPHDVLIENQPDGEHWLILRYLIPEMAQTAVDYLAVVPEMDRICATTGLARAAELTPPPGQIVIVLMDRVVPRGVPDPEATQFIASYLAIDGECLWE